MLYELSIHYSVYSLKIHERAKFTPKMIHWITIYLEAKNSFKSIYFLIFPLKPLWPFVMTPFLKQHTTKAQPGHFAALRSKKKWSLHFLYISINFCLNLNVSIWIFIWLKMSKTAKMSILEDWNNWNFEKKYIKYSFFFECRKLTIL